MTNQTKRSQHSTESNKPIDHVRLGSIRAAIWRNTDSKGHVRYNATLERGYVDQKGDWQSTTSYGRDDLLTLSKIADLANTRIHEIQAEDREHSDRSAATAAAASEHVATR